MTELNQIHDPATTREFTGKHMLMIMLGFFGVIIAVNVGLAILASKTWTGLVVKNSYVASQDFNDHLAKAQVQEKLGWEGKLSFKNGSINFVLTDKEGEPISLDAVSVKIGRPAFEQKDETIILTKVGGGKYRGKVTLAEGPWAFSLRGRKGDQPYRLETRFELSAAEAAKAGN